MGSVIEIKQGLKLKIAGAPSSEIAETSKPQKVTICPKEIEGIKIKLSVKEGDSVNRGSVLYFNKKNEVFKFRSPVAGTVESIVYGARRSIDKIIINTDNADGVESFKAYGADELIGTSGDELAAHLADSGLLALIQQRPFSKPAQPGVKPKSIFVNAMSTAPFRPDINAVITGNEANFQAGLDALTRLTDGEVYVCIDSKADNNAAVKDAKNVNVQAFSGNHPAGNTSTHIHNLDPIAPGDNVWAIDAVSLLQIGEFLLRGVVPDTKFISAGGHGLKEGGRKHYRVFIGAAIGDVLGNELEEGENRLIQGDIFAGDPVSTDDVFPFIDNRISVIPEDRERHFMGWLAPGAKLFSTCHAYLSPWFGAQNKEWALGTSRNGSLRAMVLTGIYDKYVSLDIMVDYMIRACIARDTDEAIALGILESDPEDFALCSMICPSKTDFSKHIRKMLNEIEKEGL